RETPVHGVFPARSKLNRAQIGARLRVAPGTCVPVVAIRATEIPPSQPLYRGFPEVSSFFVNIKQYRPELDIKISHARHIGVCCLLRRHSTTPRFDSLAHSHYF
ncbi:MAG: hypothetical protein ACK5GN_09710, partial [Pseudomonadota bacterium]